MGMLINLLISATAVFLSAYILPGVKVDSFIAAGIVAIVLGLLNAFLKPVIDFFTIPINFLTLGIFSFIINILMVMLTDHLVDGFMISNIMWAAIFSIVLSIINAILDFLAK